jgi:hypothetical protein
MFADMLLMGYQPNEFLIRVVLAVGALMPLIAFAAELQTPPSGAEVALSAPATQADPAAIAVVPTPTLATPLPKPGDAAASDKTPSLPAPGPATITITTGGENKINNRVVALFSKTTWRLNYPEAPEIEKTANQALAADGYDVEKRVARYGWYVETVLLGDPEKYVPPGDGNEESKANFEKGGRFVVGLLASVLSGGRIDGGNIAGSPTLNRGDAKYITKDMVNGIPPGAKKMLLTRLVNPFYRAQQEILTIAYTDISDEDLRRINAGPMLEMIGIKLNGDKKDEK